jgi:hypothetical protein
MKIGTNTKIKGSAKYKDKTGQRFELKVLGAVDGEVYQAIEDASAAGNLYVNAEAYESSMNSDFQQKPITFEHRDNSNNVWRFRLK